MSILTITTDFGLTDGYVGVMKGVIWGIAPDINIVDITHMIPSQDIFQGAVSLMKTTPFFPDGSVHLVVIDPGVGTHRRAIAAHIAKQFYVIPDNGLLTYLLAMAKKNNQVVEIVDLENKDFWLKDISHVFHGRDIFAPVAAHLSNGTKLENLGSPISDPILLNLPEVKIDSESISGEVIFIDSQGNITINISTADLKILGEDFVITLRNFVINGVNKKFADRKADKVVAVVDRQGDIRIVFNDKNDFISANIKIGDRVQIKKGKK